MKIIILSLFFILIITQSPVYRVKNRVENDEGITADLELESGRFFSTFNKKRGPYGEDIKLLQLLIRYDTDDRVHFKIIDKTQNRWEVPSSFYDPIKKSKRVKNYSVLLEDPFKLTIKRTDGEVLFESEDFVVSIKD
jgi:alpha-glucosidase